MAEEEPWGWSRSNSYLITQPALLLVEYNGSPEVKKLILELADGLLGHRRGDESGRYRIYGTVNYKSDEDSVLPLDRIWPIFWASWRWTGNRKYLEPLVDEGPRTIEMINSNVLDQIGARQDVLKMFGRTSAGVGGQRSDAAKYFDWQVSGDKEFLEELYGSQFETSRLREYINTEGSLWIDRVSVPSSELQRARLGGIALIRNAYYPGHNVSWTFQTPANEESLAILIPNATSHSMKIIAYNLGQSPVNANMTGWDVDPGRWQITQGTDQDGDDEMDGDSKKSILEFERSRGVSVTFPPHATTILDVKLLDEGTPYWARPDLGIGRDDVVVKGRKITVTVHGLGSVDSQPVDLALLDHAGRTVTHVLVPAIKAPLDLMPKTVSVTLTVPYGVNPNNGTVVLDPNDRIKEITKINNQVRL
jgi:hypothetical protein